MKIMTVIRAISFAFFFCASVTGFGKDHASQKDALLEDLQSRLIRLHDVQAQRYTSGQATVADVHRVDVMLNQVQYLLGKKTRAEFLKTSAKLHREALAAFDTRYKSGNAAPDEIESVCESAIADRLILCDR